jgi:CHAD domain-containing protein
MPLSESLQEYYLNQYRTIEHYLELCKIYADPELIHELRLGIKKLRAFNKLNREIYVVGIKDLLHNKHRINLLFKLAGELRDTQVQLHLLATVENNSGIQYSEFSRWLLKREKKRIVSFGKNTQKAETEPDEILNKNNIGFSDVVDNEAINAGAVKVLHNLCSKAKKISAGNLNDRNLHRVRTITKQIRYIINILHNSCPEFLFEEISIDSLRTIEAAAGLWHDCLVRVELLGKFLEKFHITEDWDKVKYQELFAMCKSELEIAYTETCHVVCNELLAKNTE